MENDWSADIECVLENIRHNSVILSQEHKKRYFELKECLKYYKKSKSIVVYIIISNIYNYIKY